MRRVLHTRSHRVRNTVGGARQIRVQRARGSEGDAGCVTQLESPHLGIAGSDSGEATCARGGFKGVSGAVLHGEKKRRVGQGGPG